MRTITIMLATLSFLLLPCNSFAQIQSNNQPSASPQGAKCRTGTISVRIKLISGEKIEGGLLEKTDDAVQVCKRGVSRTIATTEIDEINTRMTGNQRVRHTFKVLGIAWGVSILLGLMAYGTQ
jgi:hypothetical protein